MTLSINLRVIAPYLTLHNVALFALSTISVAFVIIRLTGSRRPRATKLLGPQSKSFVFGVTRDLFTMPDPSLMYEAWENKYGPVYWIPSSLGSKILILSDPKTIMHFFSKDAFVYHQTPITKYLFLKRWGKIILAVDGETHKRQRKALTPAFSTSAIRNLTSVFFDSAYTLKGSWDSTFESNLNESLTIDVQKWMNNISLDIIGIGGFSHDFGSLKGKKSPVMSALDAFETVKPSISTMITFLFGPIFPSIFASLPSKRVEVLKNLAASLRVIAKDLFEKAKKEKAAGVTEGVTDKSIIGMLMESASDNSALHMPMEDIINQINILILAGYETTAITLTWALIELSRNPEQQKALRTELSNLSDDPTYEQLTNGLPHLDAFVCETLRLHPAIPEVTRQAQEDDIIPLTKPMLDADGKLVDSIVVAKGTTVRIPIPYLNCSKALWGTDAKEFKPSRWLDHTSDGISQKRAVEIQGYRHLLTFVDGPRMCIGKTFVLTEIKAILSVLIRNFTFELPDGPLTKIESHRSLFPRPKVAGEEGPRVPLVVRRVE